MVGLETGKVGLLECQWGSSALGINGMIKAKERASDLGLSGESGGVKGKDWR